MNEKCENPAASADAGVAGAAVTTPNGNTEDRLISRTEAARVIGCSTSTLRRLERIDLPPIVDAEGVHYHSMQRVLEYRVQHIAAKARPGEADGATASAAFELFDASRGPADAVKQLRIDPSAARALYRDWADLRGAFVVGGEAALKIEDLALGCEEAPVRNGDDLYRLLQNIEQTFCGGCNRRTARFCMHCFLQRPPRASKLAAQAVAASEARAKERYEQQVAARAAERARGRDGS